MIEIKIEIGKEMKRKKILAKKLEVKKMMKMDLLGFLQAEANLKLLRQYNLPF